jgi:predicted aminopeptidase
VAKIALGETRCVTTASRSADARAATPSRRHKVGDTIYVSGQLSHDDEGKMIAPPPLDPAGKIADHGNMGPQMAQSYADVKKKLWGGRRGFDTIVALCGTDEVAP